ncbi:MAG: dihydrofolate reductase [Bacteroidia bacterium]
MKIIRYSVYSLTIIILSSFGQPKKEDHDKNANAEPSSTVSNDTSDTDFKYEVEKFADLRVLRYRIPGFETLTPKQKELLYYLYQASYSARDIYYDQNYKYNLTVRHTLEAIINTSNIDTASEEYKKLLVYTKRVWFSSGIHHHYSNDKFIPEFTKEYFAEAINKADHSKLPLNKNETVDAFVKRIMPIIFDPTVAPKKVNLDSKVDMVKTSAVHHYEGVTQAEVLKYYENIKDKTTKTPISYGLNSRLVKEDGKIFEKPYKIGGIYSLAIEKMVYWLEKATTVAENDKQKEVLEKLITYYKSGDLKDWDTYCIAWVGDVDSRIDLSNGFIEVYDDPLGMRGSFESVVSFKDMEATKRIEAISKEAQWFEDNSPYLPEHKKKNVKGISAKVITVVAESGSASPTTPIGINLPNSEWIREQHGSKSVNLGNIVDAANKAASGSSLQEFCYTPEEVKRGKEFAPYADMLHTDMHEVIGHASGQINPGVGQPNETLKNYASSLEEARADLVALYYLLDKKLIDIGVMESLEYGKAAYEEYIRNGLMLQLKRIKVGDKIEEAHMRNRQLIAKWVYEKGQKENVIEKKIKDGKTYFVINDYDKLRTLFGDLLREIQRIKSTGDYKAGHDLVENYGVNVDPALHKEVLERYSKLNIAPYSGYINPVLIPIMKDGKIIDVKVEYPTDFKTQMLEYDKDYSFLPVIN